jgi:hypothetical protein
VSAIAIQQLETVIARLTRDKAFRVKYCQDPDATLKAYLSPEEIQAVKTGDGHWLARMGCSEHMENLTAAFAGPHPAD